MGQLPSGSVTFLFTDIEGSTRLFRRLGPDFMLVLEQHNQLLRQAFEAHGGAEIQTAGDSFLVAFSNVVEAVRASVDGQLLLAAHDWPPQGEVQVRMGVHCGTATPTAGNYVSLTVHEAARVMDAANGGQVLLSPAAAEIAHAELGDELELADLGEYRLKDFDDPQHLYQVLHPALSSESSPPRVPPAHIGNLPVARTSFVGRDAELGDLLARLHDGRVLSILGPGGCGKTRLALEAAAQTADRYLDGAWFAELAPLRSGELVLSVVARALSARESPGRGLEQALLERLADRRCLLVLDNCEHVIRETAALCDRLLSACPGLTILATSREPLGIEGEVCFRLSTLSSPSREAATSEDVLASDAGLVFVQRARAAGNELRLDDENACAVASICRRLDGIPLAIELAAARCRMLSPVQIDQRLDNRFALLTGGPRSDPRQQTLRALVDWSYDLLGDRERTLLNRCSVFAGSFSLSAAEVICAGDPVQAEAVMDLVFSLVDRSLLVAEEQDGEMRYRMLETIRAYASERLDRSTREQLLGRHLEWCLQLARQAQAELHGVEQKRWLDALEREHKDLRAALGNGSGPPVTRLRLAVAMAYFWEVRGYLTEGRRWLEQMPAPTGDLGAADRAHALLALGSLEHRQGDAASAQKTLRAAATLFDEQRHPQHARRARAALAAAFLGSSDFEQARRTAEIVLSEVDVEAEARTAAAAQAVLGRTAFFAGDYTRASEMLRSPLEAYRAFGDLHPLAELLYWRGSIEIHRGELDTGEQSLEEALAIARKLEDKPLAARAVVSLQTVSWYRGDLEAMEQRCEQAHRMMRDLDDPEGIANAVSGLGLVASLKGDHRRARALLERALITVRSTSDRRRVGMILWDFGEVLRRAGDLSSARRAYSESLATLRELEDVHFAAMSLTGLAAVACDDGRHSTGLRMIGAAASVLDGIHAPLPAPDRDAREQALMLARDGLGPEAAERELSAGRHMALEEAVDLGLAYAGD